MMSLAAFCVYSMQVFNTRIITEMTVKTNVTGENSSEYCPATDNIILNSAVKSSIDNYNWTESMGTTVKNCYFFSYTLTHLVGAVLSEKIGGKYVLGFGMFLSGVLSLATPVFIIETHGFWGYVAGLRIFMGVGHGVVLPVTVGMLGQWIPLVDKNFMACLSFSGGLLGVAVTKAVVRETIAIRGHWDIPFYLFGGISLIWYIVWQIFCYSYPRTNPCLKEKERQYLDKELIDVSTKRIDTPLKEILTSLPVWALIVGQFGHNWGWYTMLTQLPQYMTYVLKFNVHNSDLFSALPWFFVSFSAVFFGWMADWFVRKKYMRLLNVRRIFATLGQVIPGVFMIAAGYCGCHRPFAVTCFSLSSFFMGFYYPGVKVNALDLTPNFAGSVTALADGIGVIPGMLYPKIVRWIATNETMTQWQYIFWITCAWLAVSNMFYVKFLSVDVQPWNYREEEEEEDK